MAPTTKKSSSSSKTRSSVSLAKVKGENFYRDVKKISKLNLLKSGKPVRDKEGNIIQAAAFQKGEAETKPGRVQPDRRWFGMYCFLSILCGLSCSKVRSIFFFFCKQGIRELYPKRLSITFVRVFLRKKMIPILSCYGGINFQWLFWTMLQILI